MVDSGIFLCSVNEHLRVTELVELVVVQSHNWQYPY